MCPGTKRENPIRGKIYIESETIGFCEGISRQLIAQGRLDWLGMMEGG